LSSSVETCRTIGPTNQIPASQRTETSPSTKKLPKDLGVDQRDAVLGAVSKHFPSSSGIKVYYTPGNHDLGDDPDDQTLKMYKKMFGGSSTYGRMLKQSEGTAVAFLHINSQIYQSTSTASKEEREMQNKWLENNLAKDNFIGDDTKLIVVFTHIPPFFDHIDEPEGWGNWLKEWRTIVFDLLAKHQKTVLWVCGHFHTNVERQVEYNGIQVYIRVTSSAGSFMQWKGPGVNTGELTPKIASEVAGIDVVTAFNNFIAEFGTGEKGDAFKRIADRITPDETHSGMRVFEICPEQTDLFKSRWYNVSQFDSLNKDTRLYEGVGSLSEVQSSQATASSIRIGQVRQAIL